MSELTCVQNQSSLYEKLPLNQLKSSPSLFFPKQLLRT